MKQAEFKALEAIFEREIDGTLPYQSNKKIYKELETAGLVQFDSEIIGKDMFGLLEVAGWYLTQAGRYAYCSECDLK